MALSFMKKIEEDLITKDILVVCKNCDKKFVLNTKLSYNKISYRDEMIKKFDETTKVMRI